MTGGVYEIAHTKTGRRYIGSAGNFARRFARHSHSLRRGNHHSIALQRAWNKYGEAAFQFRPLLICAPKDLTDYEQRCFDGLRPEYNISPTAGSPRGVKHPLETRAKVAAARRGKKASAETRIKIGLLKLGNKNGLGKVCSAEKRAKIAASNRGQKRSAETCAKLSALSRGRIPTSKQLAALKLR